MSVVARIEDKVHQALQPDYLQVINESHNHSRGQDTHFRLVVVTDTFDGERLPTRHRRLYQILDDELKNGVHALTMHTYTNAEWQKKGEQVAASPACRGGSKGDLSA